MLNLTRYSGQSVLIGDNVKVTVLSIFDDQVKFGVDAPKNISVHREEIYKRIQTEEKET